MDFILCILIIGLFQVARVIGQENCELSETTVNGRQVCRGKQIFFEDFDSLRSDFWKHEIFIPWTPDYEFNYFDKAPNNSFVDQGKLVIRPTILENDFVRSGSLHLVDCTGKDENECSREAQVKFPILPPIRSARLTTKNSFSFKYGKIEIRAKFPKGDWIIPELWLVPKREEYGPDFESGRMIVAMSRGNKRLFLNENDIGATVMQSGVVVSSGDNLRSRKSKIYASEPWHSRYHTYGIDWSPEGIQVLIDGEVRTGLLPIHYSGKLVHVMGFNATASKKWSSGNRVAPFDKEFYISIGLSAGGVREFPDNSINDGEPKPWKNFNPRNMVSFWLARDKWMKTWSDADSRLEVQKISVSAL